MILGGVALLVGMWFVAHRHGHLRGMVDADKNGISDGLEAAFRESKVRGKTPDNS